MSLFTDDDVISTYTDAHALADGVLIDLPGIGCRVTFRDRAVNRMTVPLFEALKPFLIDYDEPTVPTPPAATLTPGQVRALASTLRAKLAFARDTARPGEERDYLYELPGGGQERIWLIRNEVDGWTVMFASGY